MRYALVFHAPEPGPEGPPVSAEDIAEMQQLMTDYADALQEAGVMVAAEMLHPSSATRTVTRRTGPTQIADGPFAATKEALAGVFVIDVESAEAAMAWGERFPGTSYGVVEVRRTAVAYVNGRWQEG